MQTPVVGLLAVVLVAACAAWVFADASAMTSRRRPVVAVLFGHTIGEPGTWAVLCLLACVVFVPIYLVSRRNS